MKARVGKITFCSFSYRYIINKLRVFNVVRLSAAPPKIKCEIDFFRSLLEHGNAPFEVNQGAQSAERSSDDSRAVN